MGARRETLDLCKQLIATITDSSLGKSAINLTVTRTLLGQSLKDSGQESFNTTITLDNDNSQNSENNHPPESSNTDIYKCELQSLCERHKKAEIKIKNRHAVLKMRIAKKKQKLTATEKHDDSLFSSDSSFSFNKLDISESFSRTKSLKNMNFKSS